LDLILKQALRRGHTCRRDSRHCVPHTPAARIRPLQQDVETGARATLDRGLADGRGSHHHMFDDIRLLIGEH